MLRLQKKSCFIYLYGIILLKKWLWLPSKNEKLVKLTTGKRKWEEQPQSNAKTSKTLLVLNKPTHFDHLTAPFMDKNEVFPMTSFVTMQK